MKPLSITFVRHGESIGNIDRSVYSHTPDWKLPLTAKGRKQSIDAGHKLASQFQACTLGVYVSPYTRTRQTLDGIMEGIRSQVAFVKEDPRLREQEWGNLRPNNYQKIEHDRDTYGPFFYRFLHGESGADVYDRATGFLNTIYRDFEKPDFPRHIIVVTHGFTMRILLMRWLHWSVEHFHGLKNPHNCEMHRIELQSNGKYQLMTELEEESEEFRMEYRNQFFD